MKQYILTTILAISLYVGETPAQQGKNIFSVKLEHHLISSGNNRPNINLYRDSTDYFLYALHRGMKVNQFAIYAGWSDSLLQKKTDQLIKAGFLTRSNKGKLYPACMITTQRDGRKMFILSETTATIIADSIRNILPLIEQLYPRLSFSTRYNFHDFAFFLLSDVLLDNWQINNLEREFLKSERTLHHGKHYYYQIAELEAAPARETFGIYGNQVRCADTICAAVYGNRRSGIQLERYFNDPTVPYVLPEDEKIFDEMANRFLPVLLKILKGKRAYFEKQYRGSVYRYEISFNEYFLWVYHFIYTRATDIMAERKMLTIPGSGNFFYRGK